MAVKTFSVGEVLTASDTNTYLNNGGLVYITATTVGSAVSTATVSNCFSSTYANYRVIISGINASVNGTSLFIRFDAGGTTNYYSSVYYDQYTGTDTATLRRNGAASGGIGVTGANSDTSVSIDIYNPNGTTRKNWSGTFASDGWQGWCGGLSIAATQYTDLTILCNSGTMTGGTIRVYGYRQA